MQRPHRGLAPTASPSQFGFGPQLLEMARCQLHWVVLGRMPLRELPDADNFPALDEAYLDLPDRDRLEAPHGLTHPPRILMLYGSLRERSYSRFLTEEAGRLLRRLGAEVRVFDPRELPLAGSVPDDHPRIGELRSLSIWSELVQSSGRLLAW